ncbi:MAG: hypothetical protein ACREAB_04655 [Blastocatellia bacterium]
MISFVQMHTLERVIYLQCLSLPQEFKFFLLFSQIGLPCLRDQNGEIVTMLSTSALILDAPEDILKAITKLFEVLLANYGPWGTLGIFAVFLFLGVAYFIYNEIKGLWEMLCGLEVSL